MGGGGPKPQGGFVAVGESRGEEARGGGQARMSDREDPRMDLVQPT